MKTSSFFGVLMLLWLMAAAHVQAQNTPESIKAALKTGNTDALAQFFAPSVDLILPNAEDSYPRAAAIQAVRSFFAQNRPTGFTQKHETVAPNGAKCIIGILATSGGNFRASVLIKGDKIEEFTVER